MIQTICSLWTAESFTFIQNCLSHITVIKTEEQQHLPLIKIYYCFKNSSRNLWPIRASKTIATISYQSDQNSMLNNL